MSNESIALQPARSKRTLWLVAIVCIAPFIGSFLAYHFYAPEGRVNYGTLLETRPLADMPLKLTDGKPFTFSELKGKWVFVTVDEVRCDAYCDKKLWQIRQIRKTQGKYPERIERVWLMTGQGQPAKRLLEEYDGMRMAFATANLLEQFPHAGRVNDHIYLLDPLGNLVLRYPRDANPTRIRKDLERLLKVSRMG